MTSPAIPLYHFNNLSLRDGIGHFVTTRNGGKSDGAYSSLNLGLHNGDSIETVLDNRRILAETVRVDPDRFVFANQVHEGTVLIVKAGDRGRGFFSTLDAMPDCDALVTNVTGICLAAMVADCVPILLYDPVKGVIAVVHAGWRGTVKSIAVKTINAMRLEFRCKPGDILAGIGPSIGPCCYRVGQEVEEAVLRQPYDSSTFLLKESSGTSILDLWEANRQQLLGEGVSDSNIEISAICTQCNHATYYSSRAAKGITGRFVAGIYLKQ